MVSTPIIWGESAKTTGIAAAAAGAAGAAEAAFCRAVTCAWSWLMSSWSSWTVGPWFAVALDWFLVVATNFDNFQLLGAFGVQQSRVGDTLG